MKHRILAFALIFISLAAWHKMAHSVGTLPPKISHEEILSKAHLDRSGAIPIAYLKGTAYEIGYQQGFLFKDEVHQLTDQIVDYFSKHKKLSYLRNFAFKAYLDWLCWRQSKYIPQEYKEEMQGLADGSGVAFKKIWRAHIIPELFPTLCSSGAFFGPATQNGKLFQMRNIDWELKIGVQERACLLVVQKEGKLPFVNIGYPGMVGVLSGMNAQGISIAQIGSETEDRTLIGTPMLFLLRRILENAYQLEDAVEIIQHAKRTVGHNYLFASALENDAAAVEATAHHTAVFHSDDPAEDQSEYARRIKNGVIRSAFAVDLVIRERQISAKGDPQSEGIESPLGSSTYDQRYLKQAFFAETHAGDINAENLMSLAREIAPGNNLQSVVYGFPDFWVANAKGSERAVDRSFHHFNLKELLK